LKSLKKKTQEAPRWSFFWWKPF